MVRRRNPTLTTRLEALRLESPSLFDGDSRPCPLCAAVSHPRLTIEEIDYWQCGGCAFLFVDPGQAARLFDGAFYRSAEYAQVEDLWPASERVGLFQTLLEKGRAAHPKGRPTLLDLGAGLKDLERKAQLYEASTFLDPSFRHRLLTPPEALAGRRFDLVLCLEVIEHVVQQRDFFAGLAQWLAPGGLCLATTKLHNYKFDLAYLDPLMGHIAIHSLQSLQGTVRQLGLEVYVQGFSDDQYYYLALKRP